MQKLTLNFELYDDGSVYDTSSKQPCDVCLHLICTKVAYLKARKNFHKILAKSGFPEESRHNMELHCTRDAFNITYADAMTDLHKSLQDNLANTLQD